MENEKKKRGRKPKGGKIIKAAIKEEKKEKITHAIILHLKCDISNNDDNNMLIKNNEISNDNNYHYISNTSNSEKSISEKVKDINMVKRHVKTTKEKKGGIFSKESFIHLSNLKLIDEKTKTKKTEAKK